MDVKLFKRVSKFKMSDSKAGLWACPKPPKFCLDFFSLTFGRIVLKFGNMVDLDVKFQNSKHRTLNLAPAGPKLFRSPALNNTNVYVIPYNKALSIIPDVPRGCALACHTPSLHKRLTISESIQISTP